MLYVLSHSFNGFLISDIHAHICVFHSTRAQSVVRGPVFHWVGCKCNCTTMATEGCCVCECTCACIIHSILLGLGGAAHEHKSTIHAIIKVARGEGVLALYTG